ncbi:hypothetical protein [uncultured Bacteroides sp.]|uniref:hypothetical protein n=1 Tax=uncultured Bacteroides sp. TaxID=162156 RepID=UPI0025EC601F|nr:hypothetical protein [uncultured Bacteroides sp.]
MRNIFILFIIFLLYSCENSPSLIKKELQNFNYKVFDVIKYENSSIKQLMGKKTILYVFDGSCSECIGHFVNFQKNKLENDITIPCLYIVNSCDIIPLNFYLDRNKIELGVTDYLVQDSLDIFHTMEPDEFSGNQIFIIDNDLIYQLCSYPFKDVTSKNEFIKMCKNQ